jgi:cobalamin-dependent methionine synthase I
MGRPGEAVDAAVLAAAIGIDRPVERHVRRGVARDHAARRTTTSSSELADDELVQQMHDDLYDGLKDEIEEAVNILLERGWTPYDILTKALVEGMRIVGIDFRDGILFVPEVLLAANAMKAACTSSSRCWSRPARRAWARW